MSLLMQSAVFLGAAVIAVPISRRLGLGSVLGYLAAGATIGPWGFGLISDVKNILHFAEFGVVLLLFVIGLELQPSRLWTMRRPVFGLGGLQVTVTALLIAAAALSFGLEWRAALVAGLALALSSTAFALQLLAEKQQMTTRHGRTAFSILLFQDIAVIPILALVPLMSMNSAGPVDPMGVLIAVAKVGGIIAAVILVGRFALRHVFRLVARSGIHEIFTACALLTVIGTALIMEEVGLSMALGAFLAGVLMADSEFRHALEADIDPFKGLLLGLFFIAVGMSVNFGLLATELWLVLALVLGLTALKVAVLYGLGVVSGHPLRSGGYLAISLSQGGEFAFVILTIAVAAAVIPSSLSELLILVVTFSMALTPVLYVLYERILAARKLDTSDRPYDVPADEENQVIIAGFGRFGQIVGRVLQARKIAFTALESSSQKVDFVANYGNKVYYGDAGRVDLLRAAGAENAVIFIIAVDDADTSVRIAQAVVENFPDLRILARARNRQHAYRLMDVGVAHIWRETFHSSLDTARHTLTFLGLSDIEADRTVQTFREHDEARLVEQHGMKDDAEAAAQAQEWARELEEILAQDKEDEKVG
jgi:monovalent cation:proton antiporter-2 (CPA2) family protein